MPYIRPPLKHIATEVVDNFEDITGYSLEKLSSDNVMDPDFIEDTVYSIVGWISRNYPGVDALGRHSKCLQEIDKELKKIV